MVDETPSKLTILAVYSLIPIVATGLAIWVLLNPDWYKTEKGLIDSIVRDAAGRPTQEADSSSIYYLHKVPFSARFYSRGLAKVIEWDELITRQSHRDAMYVAIRKRNWDQVPKELNFGSYRRYENQRHILIELPAL